MNCSPLNGPVGKAVGRSMSPETIPRESGGAYLKLGRGEAFCEFVITRPRLVLGPATGSLTRTVDAEAWLRLARAPRGGAGVVEPDRQRLRLERGAGDAKAAAIVRLDARDGPDTGPRSRAKDCIEHGPWVHQGGLLLVQRKGDVSEKFGNCRKSRRAAISRS